MVCTLDLLVMYGQWLFTDLIRLLCDIVQSVVCELYVSQEHVTLTSLLKSFLLLTKVHKKVSVKSRTSQYTLCIVFSYCAEYTMCFGLVGCC